MEDRRFGCVWNFLFSQSELQKRQKRLAVLSSFMIRQQLAGVHKFVDQTRWCRRCKRRPRSSGLGSGLSGFELELELGCEC